MLKKNIHGLAIAALAVCAGLLLYFSNALSWFELKTWDIRCRLLARPAVTSSQVVLILIDQPSLDWAAKVNNWPWPWPREVYSVILDFCNRGGAKAVALDITFTESSTGRESDDQALGESIARNSNTVNSVVTSFRNADNGASNTRWPTNLPAVAAHVDGLQEYIRRNGSSVCASNAAFPAPLILTNCHWLGHVYGTPDQDAITRRTLLFNAFDGRFMPSLALATYMAGGGGRNLRIADDCLIVDGKRISIDNDAQSIIKGRGPLATRTAYNAALVIQSELRLREGAKPTLDSSAFKDKYVFVGGSAPAMMDLKSTPFTKVCPGTAIHADTLDNLLAGDFVRDAPRDLSVALIVILAIAASFAGRLCQKGWQMTMLFILLLPAPFLLSLLAFLYNMWLPVAVPEVTVAFALLGALVVNYSLEGRQKRFIKSAFKQYLSGEIIDQLVEDPGKLTLGGESRELTIFFSDVEGFTTISEALTADALTSLMNEYLSAASDIIMENGGTVDKYIGDAIVAFWNAPLNVPDHASRAVRSALLCQKKLATMRPDLLERFGQHVYSRIGLSTGTVKVGNMGSTNRFNYTFIGDAGNLASRLEGINKQFGTYIMISEYTKAQIGDEFALRELSRVTVKGRHAPLTVYEPMFKEDYAARAGVLKAFDDALQAYYAGDFTKAIDMFRKIEDADPPAHAYIKQCQRCIEKPVTPWTGVWNITEK